MKMLLMVLATLAVGGALLTVDTPTRAYAAGTWAATDSMAIVRGEHTATLLPNGTVLVTGGRGAGQAGHTEAEIYDPGTGTWSATGPMSTRRSSHTATLLQNGKVLVAGGYDGGVLSSAELYDPTTGTWSAAGDIGEARFRHVATLLPDGKVLVTGGSFNGMYYQSSSAVYDPGTNTWSATASMSIARQYATATLLPTGKVLVTGGRNASGIAASAELYDPAAGTWSATASMSGGRTEHTATLLESGEVLVVGGASDSPSFLDTAELYDPLGGTWSATGSMTIPRRHHASTLLLGGRVLVSGGDRFGALSSAQVFDPVTGTWSTTGDMTESRWLHTTTLLPNGDVLAAGALNGGNSLSTAEIYDGPPPCEGDIDCDYYMDPPAVAHQGPANPDAAFDNCPDTPNPIQTNTSGNYIDHSPPFNANVDDKTWPNSDAAGDACDSDDDNDGISDADEASGAACTPAVATNPLLRDTDADRFLDGAECALGTNPTSSASKPLVTACGSTTDVDGDKLTERVEICFYGTDPNNSDTDGDKALDGAKDGCEAASFNGDRIVNVADMGMLATAITNPAFRVVSVDVNKDGVWNPADQGLVASFISPSGQCPG